MKNISYDSNVSTAAVSTENKPFSRKETAKELVLAIRKKIELSTKEIEMSNLQKMSLGYSAVFHFDNSDYSLKDFMKTLMEVGNEVVGDINWFPKELIEGHKLINDIVINEIPKIFNEDSGQTEGGAKTVRQKINPRDVIFAVRSVISLTKNEKKEQERLIDSIIKSISYNQEKRYPNLSHDDFTDALVDAHNDIFQVPDFKYLPEELEVGRGLLTEALEKRLNFYIEKKVKLDESEIIAA
jgi:hypothetical protein